MKVAIVQEWLTTIGGSENVVKEIYAIYPQADVYTLVALDATVAKMGLRPERVFTSFIQNLPFGKSKYRNYLPLFPLAIEQFDLAEYDLIISSSHAVAKGVITHSGQVHICYCHSPIRYAWDLHHQYLRESGLTKGLKGWIAKYTLHRIRIWDYTTANRVDHFISNSDYIGKRIRKVYGRESTTIYPNVAVEDFALREQKDNFYFTCSRMVPYKKIDLIVKAFAAMPGRQLVVIGDGPDFKKISRIKKDNIRLMGHQSFDVLKDHMQRAKAFVFAAEEDFGIVPVEAMACGTPVIGFGKGGLLETVIDSKTGLFFDRQNEQSVIAAVELFERHGVQYTAPEIRAHAERFSTDRFKKEMKNFIDKQCPGSGSKGINSQNSAGL